MRIQRPRPSRGSLISALMLAAFLVGCDEERPDAYGNFESREVMVAAEATGRLVRLAIEEGDEVEVGAVVAQVDTVPLALQADELRLQRQASTLRAAEARAQLRALEAQLRTQEDDLARTRRLVERNAATASTLNQLEGAVASLEEQIEAGATRIRLAEQEGSIVASRLTQLQDRIERATVRNPVRGMVLTTASEAGEFVQTGRPLYVVAPLDTLILRAYVSGGQLASLSVGQDVEVRFDSGDGTLESRSGRLSWVASSAEFTPTPIQTREERVDQVYAIKVLVPNPDRRLKIGMPGEVVLPSSTAGDGG